MNSEPDDMTQVIFISHWKQFAPIQKLIEILT